jgi:hypothetical protein
MTGWMDGKDDHRKRTKQTALKGSHEHVKGSHEHVDKLLPPP